MTALLGKLSPSAFLREHWQKRPLLVRQAIPGFQGILDRETLLSLATRADAVSRLVVEHPRRRARWERHDGPFAHLDASLLPKSHWTLLVHGIESLVPGGWELLRRFAFIPAARIDDLMVSYAAPGGSVGPHEDRYDVFLLQGPGRRRWQVSTRGDHVFDPDAAIKVLRDFTADEEWLLEPGDMLYLPPGVAHHGVAEGPCFTYSIGFLAPAHLDLAQSFLGYLANALSIDPEALYSDPHLAPARERMHIGDAMVGDVAKIVNGIGWDRALVEEFLGCFLTRPKPHVRFHPPARPSTVEAFARRLRGRGRLTLALPSRGLLRNGLVFFNGRAHQPSRATIQLLNELFDGRTLALPTSINEETMQLLHGWHGAGELEMAR